MTEEIIKEDNPEEEDTQKGKYMTFKSGHEYFGFQSSYETLWRRYFIL